MGQVLYLAAATGFAGLVILGYGGWVSRILADHFWGWRASGSAAWVVFCGTLVVGASGWQLSKLRS